MEVSVKKLQKSRIELTVEISSADFGDYCDKAVENLAKNLEVRGFRKGFVPKETAKNYLSGEKIMEEAANLAASGTYWKAIEENNFEPVDLPKIEILKIASGNPLVYRATVPVLPELKLPDYRKIARKANEKNKKSFKEKTKVEEKEIDEAILWFRKSRAKYITVNREARVGDSIKLMVKIKDKKSAITETQNPTETQKISAFPNVFRDSVFARGEEHEGIIGLGYFLPDFEKNLIGMKAGEKKIFSGRIPETHANKEMAGRTLDFEVVLHSVSEVELPEIDDDFAKSSGRFENLSSFRRSIADGIKIEKEEKEKQKNRRELIDDIVKESEMEVPDILVEREIEREISRLKDGVESSGANFDDYLKNIKKTEDDLRGDLGDYAPKQVKIVLTLRQIAKNEEIKATEDEINEKVGEYLKRFSGADNAQREIDPERLKLYYEDAIKNEKTFQLLEKL